VNQRRITARLASPFRIEFLVTTSDDQMNAQDRIKANDGNAGKK
jgi:hypothetical protein